MMNAQRLLLHFLKGERAHGMQIYYPNYEQLKKINNDADLFYYVYPSKTKIYDVWTADHGLRSLHTKLRQVWDIIKFAN